MARLNDGDRMFVACCKEEIADGSTVVIVVSDKRKADAMARLFTDEELDYVTFRIGNAMPGLPSGKADANRGTPEGDDR